MIEAMGKKKDKGILVYISPKNRKRVKALIRELGLEMISVQKEQPREGAIRW